MTIVTITVSGISGSGKTTIATHINNYLKTIGFDVSLELTDKEMAPCPTLLHKRTASLIEHGNTTLEVIEKHTAIRKSVECDGTSLSTRGE